MIPGATIRWRGETTSSTRKDRVTGDPVIYKMIIAEDGRAECACPAFVFRGINDKNLKPEDRYKYRCKHLEVAFRNLGQTEIAQGKVFAAPSAKPPRQSKPIAVADPEPDDDEFTPIARR